MKALVTGSTGFIGSHLCRALIEQGWQVRAFHRPTSLLKVLDGLEVEHALGDLTQPESLQTAMEGVEVVFHAAAFMGGSDQPGKQYAVTVEGTRAVMQAALKAGVRRVVHTSSVAALGVPESPRTPGALTAMNENHTWNFRPDWYPYGYAKYLAELEVQKAVSQGLDAVIANPSLVFGPGDLYRQSESILMQVARRKVGVVIDGGINAVHVDDVTAGELAVLAKGRRGERYILGNENLSFVELLRCAAEVTGVPAPNLFLPVGLVRALALPAHWLQAYLDLPISGEMLRLAGYSFFYDTQKARQELDWQPKFSTRQALEDAFQWFNTQK